MALTTNEYQDIKRRLRLLEQEPKPSGPMVETAYIDIVRVLLEQEGYVTRRVGLNIDVEADVGQDLDAEKPGASGVPTTHLAAQFKYYQRSGEIGVGSVRFLEDSPFHGFNRLLLVANRPFSLTARLLAQQVRPVGVELVDLARLHSWADGLRPEESERYSSIVEFNANAARRIAQLLAKHPDQIHDVFWRQLEELLGEVFEGLGFNVVVTRPSRDGGKDLICTYVLDGQQKTYYVEVKHHQTTVSQSLVKSFVTVVGTDKVDGGLYLATSGYGPSAFTVVAEAQRPIALGDAANVVALCRLYVRSRGGMLTPLPDKWDLVTSGTQSL